MRFEMILKKENNLFINKKIMKNTKKAFSLIELLVVVIILWILATLAFLVLWDRIKEARDATRIDNLKELENKLEYYKNKTWDFPEPDNSSVEVLNWKTWKVWVFWTWVIKKIKDIRNIPLDPKEKTYYEYSISETWGLYKLKTTLEVTKKEYILGN